MSYESIYSNNIKLRIRKDFYNASVLKMAFIYFSSAVKVINRFKLYKKKGWFYQSVDSLQKVENDISNIVGSMKIHRYTKWLSMKT